jgi:hypothetical protein
MIRFISLASLPSNERLKLRRKAPVRDAFSDMKSVKSRVTQAQINSYRRLPLAMLTTSFTVKQLCD